MGLNAAQQRWVAAGLAALTGDPAGPCLVPPAGIVERIESLGAPGIEVLPLLGARAALLDLKRGGQVSCGAATRLLAAADGWLAVALARPDDIDLLPAWLGVEVDDGQDPWSAVGAAIRNRPLVELVDSGQVLGLPVGVPTQVRSGWESWLAPSWTPHISGASNPSQNDGRRAPRDAVHGLVVVDLSSLWAGPLCSRLLCDGGADVIKVESISRPDGGRQGSQAFFDVLNAGKRSVALDFADETDRRRLARLVAKADVVIEGSRPRALRQLGIVAEDLVTRGPQVWVSITGHGRDPVHELAVGFGDDAAVAGGLVAWGSDGAPRFAADAIADPLTGVAAHRAVLDALATNERGVVDVSLSGVAALVAGSDAGVSWVDLDPAEAPGPDRPRPDGSAPSLGRDTIAVLEKLGIS